MSLIQRNAVPLFILLAVIAVGVGVFASTTSFTFGQESTSCVPVAGGSLSATDAEGNPVTVVRNGDVVIYGATLGIPETLPGQTACNFQGGTLSITLPNGEQVVVAETGEIPVVQPGAPFAASSVEYTVNQNDAVDGHLTASAIYSNGESLSAEGDVVGATLTSGLRMTPPSISIEKITTTPIVFDGQSASFNITVTNTGGYDLTDVTVVDSQVDACNGMSFGTLLVGEEKTDSCSTMLADDITNEAYAMASVPGGPPEGMETIQSDVDTASVNVESLSIGIVVETSTPHVRIGNQGEIAITVIMPPQTLVNDIAVTVAAAPQCDAFWDNLPAGAVETYTCLVDTDPAIAGSLPLGTTTITGVVTGSVPDVPLMAESSVDVSVFSLALNITVDPAEQTIREGDSAVFTVNVSNQGDDLLSIVTVSSQDVPSCDVTFETLAPGEVQTYECVSDPVADDMVITVGVVATAADGAPVSAEDSAGVIILRPSTQIGLGSIEVQSEFTTSVIRLVVHHVIVTETNDGDSPLTDVYVELFPTGALLTNESPEFVGGDFPNENGELGIMEPGETWEWRVVSVAMVGDFVPLPSTTETIQYEAIGHGIDLLGGDVTFPFDAEERGLLDVPITIDN